MYSADRPLHRSFSKFQESSLSQRVCLCKHQSDAQYHDDKLCGSNPAKMEYNEVC